MDTKTPPCRATKDGVELFVKASPKAKKVKIDGTFQNPEGQTYLKVYVTEAPEDNQANKAIINLLAKNLSLPKTSITQKSGLTHRLKSFLLDGISIDEVIEALLSK
jgi:uncharacterized protein YggU (UPF0235/DUF167 family)